MVNSRSTNERVAAKVFAQAIIGDHQRHMLSRGDDQFQIVVVELPRAAKIIDAHHAVRVAAPSERGVNAGGDFRNRNIEVLAAFPNKPAAARHGMFGQRRADDRLAIGEWAFNNHSPEVASLSSRAPRSAVGTAATSRSTANCSSLSSEASAPT